MSYALAYVYGDTYGKKRVKSGSDNGSGKLRDLYAALFRAHGIMPDEVGRQNPARLFEMIDSFAEDNQEDYTGSDPYLKMFYGQ